MKYHRWTTSKGSAEMILPDLDDTAELALLLKWIDLIRSQEQRRLDDLATEGQNT